MLARSAATFEAGEPQPSSCVTGKTVWYRYTPTRNTEVTADTVGSDFDTVLAAYRGSSLGALAQVACNDDTDSELQSRTSFTAQAGQTYYFQVGGFSGDSGQLSFNVVGSPDADGDGVPDHRDNCPTVANPTQVNADRSGGGDACDPDDDNDGLTDVAEAARRTGRLDKDTDDDGLGDNTEVRTTRTNPRRRDSDEDLLADGLERGITRPIADPPGPVTGTHTRLFRADRDPSKKTNPLRKDTDRDGLLDGREDANRNGRRERSETDPLKRDTDGDGISDLRDPRPVG